ncbi:MAG: DUF1015 domain-containing protein [Oscillospiraceae bacterium]|jgi:uncharacterized protein (DUF1015 family)|nr:DUF1015 domain-containing protein [Oscillospiraceae bacterium]
MLFNPTEILLPQGVDLQKWSVVACDQFSSEREYWDGVRARVGGAPSALNIILPEAYLNDAELDRREAEVGKTAEKYLQSGIFTAYPDAFIYVERTLRGGTVRRGIVGAVDLDSYDYSGKPAPIRASEQTVPSRLPPRARARRGSPLETPHIMLLIDDAAKRIIEPLQGEVLQRLYDFELMENGGRLRGCLIDGARARELAKLIAGLPGGILVGDGNHSLAAAKTVWEDVKPTLTAAERANHPARFALAELNNVYDDAIEFHAIHRVLFGVDAAKFTGGLAAAASGDGDYVIKCVADGFGREFYAKNAPIGEIIADIQAYIDRLGVEVDYIHGRDAFKSLSTAPGNVGVYLPTMDKADLFRTVDTRGVFPRKSFSIGEAWDKRFYLECRKIKEN